MVCVTAGYTFASTDSAPGPRINQNSGAGTSEYALDNCSGPGITWYDTIAQAEAAGGVTYVRGGVDSLPGGKNITLRIFGMRVRKTWAETVTVQTPTLSVHQKGTEIAEGTVVPKPCRGERQQRGCRHPEGNDRPIA